MEENQVKPILNTPGPAPMKKPIPKLMCLQVPPEKVTVRGSTNVLVPASPGLSPAVGIPSQMAHPSINSSATNHGAVSSGISAAASCSAGAGIKVASLLPSAALAWPSNSIASPVIKMTTPIVTKGGGAAAIPRITMPAGHVSQWLTVAVSSGVSPITITSGQIGNKLAITTAPKPEPCSTNRRILPAPSPGVVRVSTPSRISPNALTIQQGNKNCLKPIIAANSVQKTAVVVSNAVGASSHVPLQKPAIQNGVILSHGKITAVMPSKKTVSSPSEAHLKAVTAVIPGASTVSVVPIGLASPPLRKKETVLVDLTEDKASDDCIAVEKCATTRRLSADDVTVNSSGALAVAGRVVNVNCTLPSTPIILHTPKIPPSVSSLQGAASSTIGVRPIITVPRLRLTSHTALTALPISTKKTSSGTIKVTAAASSSAAAVNKKSSSSERISCSNVITNAISSTSSSPNIRGSSSTTISYSKSLTTSSERPTASSISTFLARPSCDSTEDSSVSLAESSIVVIGSGGTGLSASVTIEDTDVTGIESSTSVAQPSPDSSVRSCSSPEVLSPSPDKSTAEISEEDHPCSTITASIETASCSLSEKLSAIGEENNAEGKFGRDRSSKAAICSKAGIIRVPDVKLVSRSCYAANADKNSETSAANSADETTDDESDIECVRDDNDGTVCSSESCSNAQEKALHTAVIDAEILTDKIDTKFLTNDEPDSSKDACGTTKVEGSVLEEAANVKDVPLLAKEEVPAQEGGESSSNASTKTENSAADVEDDEFCLQCDEEIPDMLSNADEESPKKLEDIKFSEVLALERQNQVAELKGTKLKFKLNEFNVLEIESQTHSDSVKMVSGSSSGNFRFGSTVLNLERALKSKQNNESPVPNMFGSDKDDVSAPNCTDNEQESREITNKRYSTAPGVKGVISAPASCTDEVAIVEDSGGDSCTITAEVVPEERRVCVCRVCGGYGLHDEFMRGGRYCSPNCCRADNQIESDSDDESDRKRRRIASDGDCKEDKENRLRNRAKDFPDFSALAKIHNSRCPWLDQRSQFSWVRYIEYCQKVDGHGKAAPLRIWPEPFPSTKNLFQPGMKLEGIDPQHQSLFCVLTVVDVMGHRVKLHFDGFSDVHDFWTYADSPNLFPVGWCERNGRDLCPPRGTLRFSWKNYLEHCGGAPAPRTAFVNPACRSATKASIVRPGMKLEAEDRKNGWICVATIHDVLDDRVLIHFDGWGPTFDFWTQMSSPYIHPVGWCSENDMKLSAPQNYINPEAFNWPEYLRETNSSAVPAKAFISRTPRSFKKDMKLEVVDKRNPMLVRVATVAEVYNYQVKIHFDGWDDMYDYWVDDHCEDLHPPSWCSKTGHPLQPPMVDEEADSNGCGVLGCKGYGHVKGPIYTTHHTSYGCPYSVQNYDKDLESLIPDRVLSKPEKKSRKITHKSVLLDLGTGDLDDEDSLKKRVRKRRRFFDEISAPENKVKISKPFVDSTEAVNPAAGSADVNCNKDQEQSADVEVHQSVFFGGFTLPSSQRPAPNWRHVRHLLEPLKEVDRDAVTEWSPEEVSAALERLPGCDGVSERFMSQGVDGEALLLITQEDLVRQLKLKLGHALKIMAFVNSLRSKDR